MDGLTPGRIVHFVTNRGHQAAIVTAVHNAAGLVSLYVFDELGPYPRKSIQYDEAKVEETWHWIEKA